MENRGEPKFLAELPLMKPQSFSRIVGESPLAIPDYPHSVESQIMKAEVMSIGDEITSGQRLDTNTQWISQALGEIGIAVGFHTTVGDNLDDHISALKVAIDRSDLVIMTGGLGPTADDLTRDAIAAAANVELELSETALNHILARYKSYGRPMPESNRSQAFFPINCQIIPNSEGTAPGIDLHVPRDHKPDGRVIALPGVPVEMKQMWQQSVAPRLRKNLEEDSLIHHYWLHCFGQGESSIEAMLPDLVRRGRDPSVGITASAATISLRVTARGKTKQQCIDKMQNTIDTIHDCLGELVFGENGQTLEDVVVELLREKRFTLAVIDAGLDGEVAELIRDRSQLRGLLKGGRIATEEDDLPILEQAHRAQAEFESDVGIAVGPLDHDEAQIAAGNSFFDVAIVGPDFEKAERFRLSGHSGWRKQRAVKQVLNLCRLTLQGLG